MRGGLKMFPYTILNILWIATMVGALAFIVIALIRGLNEKPAKMFALGAAACFATGLAAVVVYAAVPPSHNNAIDGEVSHPYSFNVMDDWSAHESSTQDDVYIGDDDSEINDAIIETLEGTWLWAGMVYYVFEFGGSGTMSGLDINWSARAGILSICSTPGLCGNNCLAPTEWYYEITGDQLTLTSLLLDNMLYTYTRS